MRDLRALSLNKLILQASVALTSMLWVLPAELLAQAGFLRRAAETREQRESQQPRQDVNQTNAQARTNGGSLEPLNEREVAQHVLSRLTFGPKPGQVEQVMEMGWLAWAEQQLKPHEIDDSAVESAKAQRWPSLALSMSDTFREYRPPYENDPPQPSDFQMRERMRAGLQRELRESVLYRAVHSERQFQEVIVEFWRNHFNVDQSKDEVAYLANHYEQQVIRAHAFGYFGDMLMASAQHPAMLIYLDNAVSQKPLLPSEERMIERYGSRDNVPVSVRALQRQRGLNENYARELMELHTLGVDSVYTEHDVREVARVLTGWSVGWIDHPRRPHQVPPEYGFVFRQNHHDTGRKTILGVGIRGSGGVNDGVRVINGLAQHPQTSRFISWKLCQYLVNDDPPERMVRDVAAVFRRTNGHLPTVYHAIITHEQFLSRENYGVKFKTPFRFIVSALRATDAEIEYFSDTLRALRMMGQPIYQCEDPTGYEAQAEAWRDPGVLGYRWDYALRLASGRIGGVTLGAAFMENIRNAPREQQVQVMIDSLIPGGVDERTRTILDMQHNQHGLERTLGVVLGAPAFQQQ